MGGKMDGRRRFVPESVIGSIQGIPGRILLSKDTKTGGQKVVVKKYDLDQIDKQDDFIEAGALILAEVSLMKQLRHPNLLPLLTSFYHDSGVSIVTPFIEHGSLRDLLTLRFTSGIPETWILSVLRDVLYALEHLHSQSIVHRSVRASHILLKSNGTCVLTGLRYACTLGGDRYEYSSHMASTNLNWLSPEILAQNLIKYNDKSDIYSLGLTASELSTGSIPFSDFPSTLMLLEKLRGSDTVPKLSSSSTDDFMDFVKACTRFDPSERPSATRSLTHPFFRKAKKATLTLPPPPSSAYKKESSVEESSNHETTATQLPQTEWIF